MKTPRFDGPFKWRALRQQLLSLCEDVQSIKKVAGRNITIDEHQGKGSVINAADTSARRGSGPVPPPGECPCALPSIDCSHAICFSFNVATAELSDGYYDTGYLVEMTDGINPYFQSYPFIQSDGLGGYTASFYCATGPTSIQIDMPMTLEDFFDHWHSISIKISPLFVTLCAYGVTKSVEQNGAVPDLNGLFVGSDQAFPGPVSISLKDIKFLSNPDTAEPDFIFPADSFDSTIGSGQSIAGDTVIISSSDSAKNGYLKTLDPAWVIDCPCIVCDSQVNLTYFSSIRIDLDVVISTSDPCGLSAEVTGTQTVTRVDRDFGSPSDPDETHFQIYCDDIGGFQQIRFNSGSTTLNLSEFMGSAACSDGDGGATVGGGTLAFNIGGGELVISAFAAANCVSPPSPECILSDSFSDTFSSIAPLCLEYLPGTYTFSGANHPSGGWTVDYTLAVTIS